MQKLLILAFLFLNSCGVAEHITQTCTGDLEQVCDVFFGGQKDDQQDRNARYQQAEIDRLNNAVAQLQQDVVANRNAISLLTVDTQLLRNDVDNNTSDINTVRIAALATEAALQALSSDVTSSQLLINLLQSQLTTLQNDLNLQTIDITNINAALLSINSAIANLQTQANTNTTTIAIFQGYNNITELVDPCGDGVGFDEVLLRLSNGTLLASVSTSSSALSTRLSPVPPSDSQVYQTTDSTSCNFKVPATGPNANKVCFGVGFSTCI
jgi:DNA repair exonuclease SbcCD ATPase subunit